MRITHWPAEQIVQRWDVLAPLFKKAVDAADGELNMVDMYNLTTTGFYHVAVADDAGEPVAVFCLRVVVRPRCRVLLGEQAGGSRMKDWIEALHEYSFNLMSAEGCDRLELVGRPGWARALRKWYPSMARVKSVNLILEN